MTHGRDTAMTYEGFFQALDTACGGKKPFHRLMGNALRAIQAHDYVCPVSWLANELTPRLVFDEHGQIHKPYQSEDWREAGEALGLDLHLSSHIATASDIGDRDLTYYMSAAKDLRETHTRLLRYTQHEQRGAGAGGPA